MKLEWRCLEQALFNSVDRSQVMGKWKLIDKMVNLILMQALIINIDLIIKLIFNNYLYYLMPRTSRRNSEDHSAAKKRRRDSSSPKRESERSKNIPSFNLYRSQKAWWKKRW